MTKETIKQLTTAEVVIVGVVEADEELRLLMKDSKEQLELEDDVRVIKLKELKACDIMLIKL